MAAQGLLSLADVQALHAARGVLRRYAEVLAREGWRTVERESFVHGLVHARAEDAEGAIFDVLNCAVAYLQDHAAQRAIAAWQDDAEQVTP